MSHASYAPADRQSQWLITTAPVKPAATELITPVFTCVPHVYVAIHACSPADANIAIY